MFYSAPVIVYICLLWTPTKIADINMFMGKLHALRLSFKHLWIKFWSMKYRNNFINSFWKIQTQLRFNIRISFSDLYYATIHSFLLPNYEIIA
jgi:hypothetical protein